MKIIMVIVMSMMMMIMAMIMIIVMMRAMMAMIMMMVWRQNQIGFDQNENSRALPPICSTIEEYYLL